MDGKLCVPELSIAANLAIDMARGLKGALLRPFLDLNKLIFVSTSSNKQGLLGQKKNCFEQYGPYKTSVSLTPPGETVFALNQPNTPDLLHPRLHLGTVPSIVISSVSSCTLLSVSQRMATCLSCRLQRHFLRQKVKQYPNGQPAQKCGSCSTRCFDLCVENIKTHGRELFKLNQNVQG